MWHLTMYNSQHLGITNEFYMTEKEKLKQQQLINELIANHESMRAFARVIGEDASDVMKWKNGKISIKVRAVISIARIFDIKPHDINPIFPSDIEFIFKKTK